MKLDSDLQNLVRQIERNRFDFITSLISIHEGKMNNEFGKVKAIMENVPTCSTKVSLMNLCRNLFTLGNKGI